MSLSDDLDKCSLVDSLFRVKGYWSDFGVDLENVDAIAVAIIQSLPDNEVIKPMKAVWRTSVVTRPSSRENSQLQGPDFAGAQAVN